MMIWVMQLKDLTDLTKVKRVYTSEDFNKLIDFMNSKYKRLAKYNDYKYLMIDKEDNDTTYEIRFYLGEKI